MSVTALPNELLAVIIDRLDINQLDLAARVCALWRTIAWGSATFWRDIRLTAFSPTALDFFQTRISCSSLPGLNVAIITTGRLLKLERAPFEKTVPSAAAIAQHLHRMHNLELRFDPQVSKALLRSLCHPAPCLQSVLLAEPVSWPERAVSIELPISLFNGFAPRLRKLSLKGTYLPNGINPALSACVDVSMQLGYSLNLRVVDLDMAQFPRVERLFLEGAISIANSHQWRRPEFLTKLYLKSTGSRYEFLFRDVNLVRKLTDVALVDPSEDIVEKLFESLQPDDTLQFSFLGLESSHLTRSQPFLYEYDFNMSYTAQSSNSHQWTFFSRYPSSWLRYGVPRDPWRIVHAELAAIMIEHFSMLPALDACVSLCLFWSRRTRWLEEIPTPHTNPFLPNLQSVTVVPDDDKPYPSSRVEAPLVVKVITYLTGHGTLSLRRPSVDVSAFREIENAKDLQDEFDVVLGNAELL